MSIKHIEVAFTLDLPPTDKLVLLALADHMHKDSTGAYPSIELLMWKTGLSRRPVQKALRRMQADRVIAPVGAVHGGRVQGGHGNSTEYKATFGRSPKGTPRPPFKPTPKPDKKGVPEAPLNTGKGVPRAPLKSKEGRLSRPKKGVPGTPEPKTGISADVPSGLGSGVAGLGPPEIQSCNGNENNRPPYQTADDSATSPTPNSKPKSPGRENKIKGRAQTILEKRGLEPEFVTAVLNLILKRARTPPATTNYYISSFENDSIDDWKAWIKIDIVHSAVEDAARTGRTATEVLRERLPEEFPP